MKKDMISNRVETPVTNSVANHKQMKKKAEATKQDSKYGCDDKAQPDNNIFFEERSNPLSSKGN